MDIAPEQGRTCQPDRWQHLCRKLSAGVLEFDVLEIVPDSFIGIQIRRIGRQMSVNRLLSSHPQPAGVITWKVTSSGVVIPQPR